MVVVLYYLTQKFADAFGEEGRDACDGFGTIPPNSALDFNLELLSFTHVVDVTADSKVVKKILKVGEGTSADEGATITSK